MIRWSMTTRTPAMLTTAHPAGLIDGERLVALVDTPEIAEAIAANLNAVEGATVADRATVAEETKGDCSAYTDDDAVGERRRLEGEVVRTAMTHVRALEVVRDGIRSGPCPSCDGDSCAECMAKLNALNVAGDGYEKATADLIAFDDARKGSKS